MKKMLVGLSISVLLGLGGAAIASKAAVVADDQTQNQSQQAPQQNDPNTPQQDATQPDQSQTPDQGSDQGTDNADPSDGDANSY